jgi:hypothetical protein
LRRKNSPPLSPSQPPELAILLHCSYDGTKRAIFHFKQIDELDIKIAEVSVLSSDRNGSLVQEELKALQEQKQALVDAAAAIENANPQRYCSTHLLQLYDGTSPRHWWR